MNESSNVDQDKRSLIKKAAYVAPVIVTMAAIPSFASAGSGWQQSENPGPRPLSVSQERQHRDGRSR